MRAEISPYTSKVVHYDSVRRRLWILGQRCHHGATGTLVAAVACLGLAAGPTTTAKPRSLVALAAGGALMVHDWSDRSIWFKPGHQHQP